MNNSLWMKDYKNLSTVPYPASDLETVPYWLAGILPLAAQLNDSKLLNVSHTYIDAVLSRQQADGWIGPRVGAGRFASMTESPWPRYRMLTVLAMYADLFPDTRTIKAMHGIVHSLGAVLRNTSADSMKFKFSWAQARWFELVENIQWLLDRDPSNNFDDRAQLLSIAATAKATGLDWERWYAQRKCVAPDATQSAWCTGFPNATSCNAQPNCSFVDNRACMAVDTDCFPCRDAKSKGCPFAAEEVRITHNKFFSSAFH